MLGDDHSDTVSARHNLACSYDSAGRTHRGHQHGEQVVAAREWFLGPEHPDTLTSRHNLALFYWSAGRTTDAIDLQEQVVAGRDRVLGPDHLARSSLATA